MPCMNCRAPVSEGEAKIIFEVFVCPRCYTVAEAIYKRADKEIKHTLVFLKDVIRGMLLDRKLQFPEQNPDQMSRAEIMKTIVQLQEAFDVVRDSSHAGNPSNKSSIAGEGSQEVRALGSGTSHSDAD